MAAPPAAASPNTQRPTPNTLRPGHSGRGFFVPETEKPMDLTPEQITEGVRRLQAQYPEKFAALFGQLGDRHESLELHVNVRMELRGPDGKLKDERTLHNLVVTVGK